MVHLFVYKEEGRLKCVTFTPKGLWNWGQEAMSVVLRKPFQEREPPMLWQSLVLDSSFSSLDFLHQQTQAAGFDLRFRVQTVY